MKINLIDLCWVLIIGGCATMGRTTVFLKGLDTFGSSRLSPRDVTQVYGARIEEWVEAQKRERTGSWELKTKIESDIRSRFGFAYANLSLISYFPPNSGDFLTVDVVESQDANRRLAFRSEPKGVFEDPDGLVAKWTEYEKVSLSLMRSGELKFPDTCPVLHCTFGFDHPKLAPFLETFNRLAPRNQVRLVRILKEDSRPQFRGSAAYLLAHVKDGRAIVPALVEVTRDSASSVRNNAVRVLMAVTMTHPEWEIPVEPVVRVLDFPDATDRNKAGYTLLYLSRKPENHEPIIRLAGPILLAMLRLQQPNNHDPAFGILKNVSGETFDEHDYSSWEKWLQSVRKLHS